MYFPYIQLLAGFILLVKGADILVEGSSSLAKKFGIPSLIIGLTIVAFGTSTPELFVNVFAALSERTEIALGNVIGSNIANILLVLGVAIIICPPNLHHATVWREVPFSFLAAIALLVVANDFIIDSVEIFSLTRVDGIVMLLFFIIFVYYLYLASRTGNTQSTELKIRTRDNKIILFMIVGGMVGLYFGGLWTVNGASTIALQFGLSEFMISATVIAIGTSLPELVASITAARKGNVDLAVGNVIGSNIFNILWILGITAVIAPVSIPSGINIDIILLVFITLLLFLFVFIGERHKLKRWQGISFVILYVLYVAFLVIRG